MANHWYVQHNGKLYGPLASGELKRLASEGKIKPTTQVRLGADGQWGAASRVQGLFAAAAPNAAAAPANTPPPAPSVTPLDLRREALKRHASETPSQSGMPPIPPPVAAPLAAHPLQASPLTASPLARAPLLSARPVEPVAAPLAAKIVGAVGMILGVLAMSTFWLPMLGSPLGWLGIGVGAAGLLVGIAGLIVSARQQASGLYLNVAAASSSVVGLVLSVVLAVTFGMFKPAPVAQQQVVTFAPQPAPVAEPPAAPSAEPEPEPEPEPPKIVWTPAEEAIEAPPIRARVASVAVEQLRLENMDLTSMKRSKAQPLLKVRITIVNTTKDKILEVPGWVGGGGLLGGQADAALGALLENTELGKQDLGKQLKGATASATLVDQAGNNYAQIPTVQVFGAKIIGQDTALPPGESSEKELVFKLPLESVEYLHLELSPGGFGGAEPLRFEIPAAMIKR